MNTKTKTKISKSLKKYHRHKKTMKDVRLIFWLIIVMAISAHIYKIYTPTVLAEANDCKWWGFPVAKDKELTTKDKIIIYANKYNVDIDEALNISWCESKHRADARNWQGSTAKGVYQFIDKTWKNYCTGDVLNDDDNIKCFMKLYPRHKSWWKCAELLNYI